jgi:hypothetical protein
VRRKGRKATRKGRWVYAKNGWGLALAATKVKAKKEATR